MTVRAPSRRSGDEGFALVAALGAALLFALFAYTVLASDRGAVAGLAAQYQRARMEAAADGALATILAGLGGDGRSPRLDGRAQTFSIDDMDVTAAVEDNRGKIPVNSLKPDQARRLLQGAGVSGRRLDALTENLLDWIGASQKPNGAAMLDYAAAGVRERNGPVRAIDELTTVRGVDADLLGRIAPALTVFPDVTAEFDPGTASPLARSAMAGAPLGTQTGGAFGVQGYVGRPLTVRITVQDGHEGVFRRTSVVELTGQARQPVWIRSVD